MVLFIWNNVIVVDVAGACTIIGTVAVLATISSVLISDIIKLFDHDRWCLISQLIKGKSIDFQKLLKYINETITSVYNVLILIGQKTYFLLTFSLRTL